MLLVMCQLQPASMICNCMDANCVYSRYYISYNHYGVTGRKKVWYLTWLWRQSVWQVLLILVWLGLGRMIWPDSVLSLCPVMSFRFFDSSGTVLLVSSSFY